MIQQVTAFAKDHEDEFIELVTKSNAKSVDREIRESKKEFEQAQARISKLDTIIQRLLQMQTVSYDWLRPTQISRN